MNSSHRRIRALERGVEWLPRHDSHYILAGMMVSARAAPPICILQHTFRELDEHLRSARDFAFGLLAGSLCTCKQSGRHYTLVDGFVPCQLPAGTDGDDPYGLIALALRQQMVILERTGKSALGFYLCDTTVVPHVALEDVGLFRSVFTQPWHMMLIRDQGDDGDLGAFIRVEPVDERAFAAPFTELISERAGRRARHEAPPSVVRWVNYQPTEPVAIATDADLLPPDASSGPNGRWRDLQKFGKERASQALSPWVASAVATLRKIEVDLSDAVKRATQPLPRQAADASAEFVLPPVTSKPQGAPATAAPRPDPNSQADSPRQAEVDARSAGDTSSNPGSPNAASESENLVSQGVDLTAAGAAATVKPQDDEDSDKIAGGAGSDQLIEYGGPDASIPTATPGNVIPSEGMNVPEVLASPSTLPSERVIDSASDGELVQESEVLVPPDTSMQAAAEHAERLSDHEVAPKPESSPPAGGGEYAEGDDAPLRNRPALEVLMVPPLDDGSDWSFWLRHRWIRVLLVIGVVAVMAMLIKLM